MSLIDAGFAVNDDQRMIGEELAASNTFAQSDIDRIGEVSSKLRSNTKKPPEGHVSSPEVFLNYEA